MRPIVIIFLLLCTWLRAGAQGGLNDQSWNYGDVTFWNNDTAWFQVKNTSGSKLVFLPTFYNEKFQVLLSNKSLAPGETARVGIIYYSEDPGKFNADVPLYVNLKADPIVFHLKGNIRSLSPTALVRCPVVNGDRAENTLEKIVVVEVRDLVTDELLLPDAIAVKSRDNRKIVLEKNNLEYKMKTGPGDYKVYASKSGYNDYYAIITLEPYRLKYIVYLEKLPEPELEKPEVIRNDSIITMVEVEPEHEDPPIEAPIITHDPPPLHEEPHEHPRDTVSEIPDKTELSREEYAINNVIIIVDISSSMGRGGKMDALIASYNTMIDALRPEDRVSIVSMSSTAQVIQPPTQVYDKDSLKRILANIKKGGGTNGGAAVQTAYQLAKQSFVAGGNNQVIIATDGIFYGGTLTRKDMEALIIKENLSGIHMSAVAFGTDPKAIMFLENLSQKGGGSLVQITGNVQEETKLLEMIKAQSKRK